MRILHIIPNYSPSVGGTQHLFQQISEKLVTDYGDEVTVFTTDSYFGPQRKQYKKIREKISYVNGVKVVRFGYFRFHFFLFDKLFSLLKHLNISVPQKLKQLRFGPNSYAMKKALYNTDFDAVCASAYFYRYMSYPLNRHKGKYPKPFVFMGALHLAEKKKDDGIFSHTLQAIKASEYFIANTCFEKKRLIDYGVNTSNIQVIGCGVDVALFQNTSGKKIKKNLQIEAHTVIGYFGRHDKIKGIDTVLYAFDEMAKKNQFTALIIAGAASAYTSEIKAIIQSFDTGVQARIFIMSDVNEKDKAALFNAFDIVVYSSSHESFGIVFLEAWACKKPVIGANIGAVRSVITHGEDGFIVQPGNSEEVAHYCNMLLSDSELRQQMGNNGFEKVKQQYTWDIVTSKYRSVYVQAINRYNTKN